MDLVIVFFILSLINVMLSTIKSILTVNGTRLTATIINAVTYGFYTIVVKQITEFDIVTTVIVTIVANLIGVYLSMFILEKTKKDSLWKISITTKNEEIGSKIIDELNHNDIAFRVYDVMKRTGNTVGLDIFSETQVQSTIVKNIINQYNVKYHVSEVKQNL